jgi:protein-tyrosine phosphatase
VIDLHTHILPGLDDGVRTLDEACDLAYRAASEGITVIAATPHVRPDFPTTVEMMEAGVAELRAQLLEEGIPVQIVHGGELDIGLLWAVPREELPRFTIAQTGRYLLVEFPYRGWPLAVNSSVFALLEMGLTPLIAHPERNPDVQDRPGRLEELVGAGALVQVTAASLDGRLDRSSQSTAERLLELGFVHVLASDAHAPHIREAGLAAAARRVPEDLARYLTVDAPAAIVAGEPIPESPQVPLGT